jgi:hypothetical protein
MKGWHSRATRVLLLGMLMAIALLAPAKSSRALTIDVTLSPVEVGPEVAQVVFHVGIQTDSGGPVDLSGYTLDFSFDDAELAFVGAEQLVRFGGGETPDPFTDDCTLGRCAAGPFPPEAALGVLQLFSLTFDILAPVDDGEPDLEVGFLNPFFDGVTQPLGEAPFDDGVVMREAFVTPEPGSHALLALGLVVASAARRRRRGRLGRSLPSAGRPGSLLALAAWVVVAYAAPAPALPVVALDVDPSTPGLQSHREIAPGSAFDVSIVISTVDDLHGFELDLGFDGLALSATSVMDGGALGAMAMVLAQDLVPPEVGLTVLRIGGVGVDLGDDSVLATVGFQAGFQPGLYDLDLNDVLLTAPGGAPIATEGLLDAAVTVVPEPEVGLIVGRGLLAQARRRM